MLARSAGANSDYTQVGLAAGEPGPVGRDRSVASSTDFTASTSALVSSATSAADISRGSSLVSVVSMVARTFSQRRLARPLSLASGQLDFLFSLAPEFQCSWAFSPDTR